MPDFAEAEKILEQDIRKKRQEQRAMERPELSFDSPYSWAPEQEPILPADIKKEGLRDPNNRDNTRLSILYPKAQDFIQKNLPDDMPMDEIMGKLQKIDKQMYKSGFTVDQVAGAWGRTPESMSILRDFEREEQVKNFVQLYPDKNEAEIKRTIEDARLLKVDSTLLFGNPEMYKSLLPLAERARNNRSKDLDYVKSLLTTSAAGLTGTAGTLAEAGAWMATEIDSAFGIANKLQLESTNRMRKEHGLPSITEEQQLNTTAEFFLDIANRLNSTSTNLSEIAANGYNQDIFQATAQAAGSSLLFYGAGAGVSSLVHSWGKVGLMMSRFAGSAASGLLEAAVEGGGVFREQLDAGATVEEALVAGRWDAILQYPINALSDGLGGFLGAKPGDISLIINGIKEMTQETLQGVLSGILTQRNPQGRPYTFGDIINAAPSLGEIFETVKGEGVPAMLSAMLFAGAEKARREYGRKKVEVRLKDLMTDAQEIIKIASGNAGEETQAQADVITQAQQAAEVWAAENPGVVDEAEEVINDVAEEAAPVVEEVAAEVGIAPEDIETVADDVSAAAEEILAPEASETPLPATEDTSQVLEDQLDEKMNSVWDSGYARQIKKGPVSLDFMRTWFRNQKYGAEDFNRFVDKAVADGRFGIDEFGMIDTDVDSQSIDDVPVGESVEIEPVEITDEEPAVVPQPVAEPAIDMNSPDIQAVLDLIKNQTEGNNFIAQMRDGFQAWAKKNKIKVSSTRFNEILKGLRDSGIVTLGKDVNGSTFGWNENGKLWATVNMAGEQVTDPETQPVDRIEQVFTDSYNRVKKDGYAKISDLYLDLGVEKEAFDNILEIMRDRGLIQLQAGDIAFYTEEEIRNSYHDRNLEEVLLTVKWRGNHTVSDVIMDDLANDPDVDVAVEETAIAPTEETATPVQEETTLTGQKEDVSKLTPEQKFTDIYNRIQKGGYARIADLRVAMGLGKAEFDKLLEDMRDRRLIQLQTGDMDYYTEEDIENSYYDNILNARKHTVKWINKGSNVVEVNGVPMEAPALPKPTIESPAVAEQRNNGQMFGELFTAFKGKPVGIDELRRALKWPQEIFDELVSEWAAQGLIQVDGDNITAVYGRSVIDPVAFQAAFDKLYRRKPKKGKVKGATAFELAVELGVPEASVRDFISEQNLSVAPDGVTVTFSQVAESKKGEIPVPAEEAALQGKQYPDYADKKEEEFAFAWESAWYNASRKTGMATLDAMNLRLEKWNRKQFEAYVKKWIKQGRVSVDKNGMILTSNVSTAPIPAQKTEPIKENDLIAIREVNEDGLRGILKNGFEIAPSIGIVKAGFGGTGFGDITFIYAPSTIDPTENKDNLVFKGDGWTVVTFNKEFSETVTPESELYRAKKVQAADTAARAKKGVVIPQYRNLDEVKANRDRIGKDGVDDKGNPAPIIYDEAKPMRRVNNSEIKGILIPSTTSSKALQELKKSGISYKIYEKSTLDKVGTRSTTLQAFLEELNAKREKAQPAIHFLETNPNVKGLFVGQRAIPNQVNNYLEAQKMFRKGVSNPEIFNQTGWYVGRDGRWKTEIIDDVKKIGLKRKDGTSRSLQGITRLTTLGNIWHDNKLFDLYPELRNIRVRMFPKVQSGNTEVAGWYDAVNKEFVMGTSYSEADILNTLVHEVQHAIQDIEGFAKGANPSDFVLKRNEDGTLTSAFDQYMNVAGEVEARDAANRTISRGMAEGAGQPAPAFGVPSSASEGNLNPVPQTAAAANVVPKETIGMTVNKVSDTEMWIVTDIGVDIPIIRNSKGKWRLNFDSEILGVMPMRIFDSLDTAVEYVTSRIQSRMVETNNLYEQDQNATMTSREALLRRLSVLPQTQWTEEDRAAFNEWYEKLDHTNVYTWGGNPQEVRQALELMGAVESFQADDARTWKGAEFETLRQRWEALTARQTELLDNSKETLTALTAEQQKQLDTFKEAKERLLDNFPPEVYPPRDMKPEHEAMLQNLDAGIKYLAGLQMQTYSVDNEAFAKLQAEKESLEDEAQGIYEGIRDAADKAYLNIVERNANGLTKAQIKTLNTASRASFEPPMPGAKVQAKVVRMIDVKRAVNAFVPWRKNVPNRKAEGTFFVREFLIRTRYQNDITVAMHEVGHAIEKRLKLFPGIKKNMNSPLALELIQNGIVASPPNSTPEYMAGEGMAQFFLYYAVNEDYAQQQMPLYYQEWKKAIAKDKETQAKAEHIKTVVKGYYSQSIIDRLLAGVTHGTDSNNEGIKGKWKSAVRMFETQVLDKFSRLAEIENELKKQQGDKYIDDEHAVYQAARLVQGAQGRADTYVDEILPILRNVKGATINLYGAVVQKSGQELMTGYLLAMAAQDFRKNGMYPGLNVDQQEELDVISATPKAVKDAAKQLQAIYNRMMEEVVVGSGMMTQDSFNKLRKKWPNYVPFLRMDTQANYEQDVTNLFAGSGKGFVNIPLPPSMRKRKGVMNEREQKNVLDPVEAMIKNIYMFSRVAARNEVGKKMMNIARDYDEMSHIAFPMTKYTNKGKPVAMPGENVFHVWDNGQKFYFETDPDIYKALMMVGPDNPEWLSLAEQIIGLPAKLLTMTATRFRPSFILRNFIMDAFGVSLNTKGFVLPFYNTVMGVAMQINAARTKGEGSGRYKGWVKEAKEIGVMKAGILEIAGNDIKKVSKFVRKAYDSNTVTRKVARGVFKLIDATNINEAIENAPKLYEYYRLRKRNVPSLEAAVRAREVNMDFNRSGNMGQHLNKITPFMNAGIQGTNKMYRVLKERPVETLAKIGMWVTLPSIFAWCAGNIWADDDDKERYRRIEQAEKDRNWVFFIPGIDRPVKIPKPQGWGVFGAFAERTLNRLYVDDPESMKNFGSLVWDSLVPNVAPQMLLLWHEASANYNEFTGRSIVPIGMTLSNTPKFLQYDERTSWFAKTVAQVGHDMGIEMSPFIIDHLIHGVLSGVGSDISLGVTIINDAISGQTYGEEREFSEWPIVNSFTVQDNRMEAPVSRFYDVATTALEAEQEYKIRTERGEEIAETKNMLMAGAFKTAMKEMSAYNKEMRAVRSNPDMTAAEKTVEINILRQDRMLLAEDILKEYDSQDEWGNYYADIPK